MTAAERQAVAFVHIVAECQPEDMNPLDIAVVDTARRISAALHLESGTTPRTSISGVPLTASRKGES
jgi:hypothetical protein